MERKLYYAEIKDETCFSIFHAIRILYANLKYNIDFGGYEVSNTPETLGNFIKNYLHKSGKTIHALYFVEDNKPSESYVIFRHKIEHFPGPTPGFEMRLIFELNNRICEVSEQPTDLPYFNQFGLVERG